MGALEHASEHYGFRLVKVKERELFDRCATVLRIPREALPARLAKLGQSLGPPWRQDEKYATLVAWLALGSSA